MQHFVKVCGAIWMILMLHMMPLVMAQEVEETEEAGAVPVTVTAMPSASLPPSPTLIPLTATMLPTVTISSSATIEPTASASPVPATATAIDTEITPLPSATDTILAATPSPAATEILIPATLDAELTEEPIFIEETEEVIIVATATIDFSTTTPVSITATPSPAMPEETAEIETSITPTATLGSMPMVFVQGVVTFQNRLPDNRDIEVQVLNEALDLLSVERTNAEGAYSIKVPVDAFYWLRFDAALHQVTVWGMQPGTVIPQIVLPGGDLNDDSCIGNQDILLLLSDFDEGVNIRGDISGDGVTDSIDLAILTGNFDADCESSLVTPTPTATIIPETATPDTQLLDTATPMGSATPTANSTVPENEEVAVTVTTTQTQTVELTEEVMVATETLLPTAEAESTDEVDAPNPTAMNTPESESTTEVIPPEPTGTVSATNTLEPTTMPPVTATPMIVATETAIILTPTLTPNPPSPTSTITATVALIETATPEED